MDEWVADHAGLVASIDVDGVTLRVVPPREAIPGRRYVVKPGPEPGTVNLKRPWSTPTLTEHDDRAIRSGGNAGAEGASAPSSTTARS